MTPSHHPTTPVYGFKIFKMATQAYGHPGGHFGQPNRTILAMLNLYVALMLPIKFQLNPTYIGRSCLKNFKMATMAAILDIGMVQFEQFWISMSLQCFPSSFSSIQRMVWEEISKFEFQSVSVTLKVRSRSSKSNHFFPSSQWSICASLNKFHLMIQESFLVFIM